MSQLELTRAIVFFDLETTGTDPGSDRIVEISALRVDPTGSRESRTRRVNPERPIPPGATAVHGIRDEDVRDAPTFRQLARGLLEWIGDADLAGFNVQRFDLPLLEREMRDCGLDLVATERRVIDVMTIFHRKEPRDLTAAVRFYLGREHSGAHTAEGDVSAAADVLEAQLARYGDLPRSVDALDAWARSGRGGPVDRNGKFLLQGGEVVFGFGRHQGKRLATVAREAPDYLRWILQSDFPPDAKAVVEQALAAAARDARQST